MYIIKLIFATGSVKLYRTIIKNERIIHVGFFADLENVSANILCLVVSRVLCAKSVDPGRQQRGSGFDRVLAVHLPCESGYERSIEPV